MNATTQKKHHHDASGKFFTRLELEDGIYWRLCRYGSSVSNAAAVEDIKTNGYKRVETLGPNEHTYMKVSVLLTTAAREDVLKEINTHMGIK